MQLELGDIIKLFSSKLEHYNDKVFVITFLNNENLVLQNIVSNEVHQLPIKNGVLLNKLIDNIHLLKRHQEKGFVQQNKMTVNMWIDIIGKYNKDLPFSFTGKITNIEEDMIEVELYGLEEETIIYIDFAYQGISPDSNIKEIHIRDKPIDDIYSSPDKELDDTSEKNIEGEIVNIDKIVYHEELLEAIQVKETKQAHSHTYSLETQINDMIEDILANNSKPNRDLLREIFVLSERYKVLYKDYISKTPERKDDIISQTNHGIMEVISNKPRLFLDDDSIINDRILLSSNDSHLNEFIENLNDQYSTNAYAERYIRTQELIQRFYQKNDNETFNNTETVEKKTMCIETNLQESPNEIQSYSVCSTNPKDVPTIHKSSFKEVISLPGDRIHIDSVVYLPEALMFNEQAKLLSTSILNKALINDIRFTNYNVNMRKLYEPVFINERVNINSENVFDKIYDKYMHFKYDSNNMSHDEFKEKLQLDKSKMILKLVKKMNTKDLSLYSLLNYIRKFAFDKDDVNSSIYENINDVLNSKLLALKKEILLTSSENSLFEKSDEEIKSQFLETYRKHVDLYMDLQNSADSEIISKMVEIDDMNLYVSSLLLTKNDFLDFTKFDKSVNKYIDSNDGIFNRGKCSKYYLTKQYHTIEQLEADNSKKIYFDKEFDKTNYGLFTVEQLEEREECINILINKYKLPEKEAIYEYESMVNKSRQVMEGDFALLYNDGKFIMFKRNKNDEWEATNQFSGMNGKEIFCNIQSDCFAMPTNTCSNLKDKQTMNTVQDAKESINDFDKDIVMKKTAFKSMMMKDYEQNMILLRLTKKHKDNQLFKQSRLLYDVGTKYTPSDVEESPYLDIFHTILNIKELDLKYSYLIQFCANFTRDANLLLTDESPHWKYCTKTNLKLVPVFMYRLAVSYHKTGLETYSQELKNLCNDSSNCTISDTGDKFIDKNSGYVIKEIDYSDTYSSDYAPINVITAPQITKYSAVTDISKEYKVYIVNIVEYLCTYMVIKLKDVQKEYIMRNVVDDFNSYFESRSSIEDENKRKNVHTHYIMYYTLSYFSIEVLTSIPSIQTNETFPGCVKSFTGFPITDKSDITGLLYIACVAFKQRSKDFPWKALRAKFDKNTKPSPETVCSTMQVFLENIVTKTSVLKKINSKIRFNEKNKDSQVKVILNTPKMFLPPQSQYDIAFTITKQVNGLTRSNLQTKSFYYTISLFKKIQDLVKKIVDSSVPIVTEPLLDTINDPYSFMSNKQINEDLVELIKIKGILDKKHYTTVFNNHKTYDLHFPTVFNEFKKKKNLMNLYILKNIDNYEDELREIFPQLPIDVPNDLVSFTEMLKQYGINISVNDFNSIYKSNNMKTLFDSSDLYVEQIDIKTELETLVSANVENYCILKVFDMMYTEKKEDYENKMLEEIKQNFEIINEYVFLNSTKKSSDKKKFATLLQNLVDSTIDIKNFWNPIRKSEDEVNIFSDIDKETTQNAVNSMVNLIDFMTRNLPEIVKRKIRGEAMPNFNNVPPPNHWNISDIHKKDITQLTKQYYAFIEKYSDCPEEVIQVFTSFLLMTKNTSKLCVVVKRFYNEKTKHNSSNESLYLTILYILFDTVKTMMQTTDDFEEKRVSQCTANIIYDMFAMSYMSDKFKQINTSYDDVYSYVNRIKESEKDTILRKLEQMNDEERGVDNEYKKYSIGDWSSGNYRTYDKSEYDDSRFSDVYKDNDFMKGLLGAVYVEQYREGDIDFEEAFDLSDIHEDDVDPNSDE